MAGIAFYNLYQAGNWFIDQMAAGLYVGWQIICQ